MGVKNVRDLMQPLFHIVVFAQLLVVYFESKRLMVGGEHIRIQTRRKLSGRVLADSLVGVRPFLARCACGGDVAYALPVVFTFLPAGTDIGTVSYHPV